jgi:hypothetical protein
MKMRRRKTRVYEYKTHLVKKRAMSVAERAARRGVLLLFCFCRKVMETQKANAMNRIAIGLLLLPA